jgi:colicin import membrane protein
MLLLSGAVHLLLAIAALSVPPLFGVPIRLEPVAVVDLVGGGEFRQEARKPPEPASRETAPRDRKDASRPPATRGKRPKAPPDTASLTERLRKLRESRARSEAVREAVEERRSEAAARAAVRSVGERVAHRIEAPQPVRTGARGVPGAGGGRGTVRVSPELVDFFRRLEERVRSSWILPGGLVRDAANLVVELRIVIEKDGRVSGERIERGSGNAFFDDSVLRAIRKASPLPTPPEQLRGGEDHYEVGFRFHGGGG